MVRIAAESHFRSLTAVALNVIHRIDGHFVLPYCLGGWLRAHDDFLFLFGLLPFGGCIGREHERFRGGSWNTASAAGYAAKARGGATTRTTIGQSNGDRPEEDAFRARDFPPVSYENSLGMSSFRNARHRASTSSIESYVPK
jgi:hypothetical protein